MSTTADIDSKMPLGVGSIIGESFSILFKHFIPVLVMAIIPNALALLIGGALVGVGVTMGTAEPDFSSSIGVTSWVVVFVLQIVCYGLTTALLVQLAYDAKLGRSVQLGRYVSPAISAAVPIAVLSLFAGVLIGLASLALIIPGIWLYAVFSMTAPAVVIERAGFRGLGRSKSLTKDYRWPIVGALLLTGICIGVFNFIATFAAGVLSGSVIVSVVAYLIPTSIGAGLASICVALIYARLREIKEGMSVDQIASVFD